MALHRSEPRTPAGLRAALALVLALAGCASVDPYAYPPVTAHLQRDDAVGDCARLLQRIDRAVAEAGVRDAQAPRVKGFPYLRVDRLTAHLAPAPDDLLALQAWRARLQALDQRARAIELANAGPPLADGDEAAALSGCRSRLAAADRAAPGLRAAAQVPDAYATALRVLGLYPLSKLLFAAGIARWQAELRALHARPLHELPRLGHPVVYRPRLPVPPSAVPAPLQADALGLPGLTPAQRQALLARHAPVLEIDTVDGDDRVGRLVWGHGGRRVVADTAQAVAYARVGYSRLGGRLLPQLVYSFWFPARPAQGPLDVLAGHLDGLVWRVTLGPDLEPLVYDTMHPCGCYHLFYPTPGVRARPAPIAGQAPGDEGLFVPQQVEPPRAGQRMRLHLAARTHYLRRVTLSADETGAAVGYGLRDEDELRRLPWPDAAAPQGTRSVYGPDGLIAGSARLERFLFWPMGIPSAGQMRQWGHHATAFVGRRHFDDPLLFERYFEPVDPGADPR